MTRRFVVIWEIDIWAKSPEAAARAALEIQRDPSSTSTVFDVWEEDREDGRRIDTAELNWSAP